MIRLSSGIRQCVFQNLQVCDSMTTSLPQSITRISTIKLKSDSLPTTFTSEPADENMHSKGSETGTAFGNRNGKCSYYAMQFENINGKLGKSHKMNCRCLSSGLTCGSIDSSDKLCYHEENYTSSFDSELQHSLSRNNSNSSSHDGSTESVAETLPSFFEQTSKLPSTDEDSAAPLATGNHGDEASSHGNMDELVPPDPETCCGSGCVNCVYIKYVQDVLNRDPNDREKVKQILDEIEDFNVRMFIKLELGL